MKDLIFMCNQQLHEFKKQRCKMQSMKEVYFTKHANKQSRDRGIGTQEVKNTILTNKWTKSKHGRYSATKIFEFDKKWNNIYYKKKEVKVIFKLENGKIIVITTIARYFKN